MNAQDLIKNKDIKLTPARKEILDALIAGNRPLCYEDIKDKLSMDKATFYRNITIFEEKKIINSFESNDKKRYFAIEMKPHPHFICTTCNKIECIDNFIDIELPNHTIENIIIKGKCATCKDKQ